MLYKLIVFVLLTAAGFLICRQILKIPRSSMKKNIKNVQAEKEQTGARLLTLFVMPLVKPVSRLIRLDPEKEAKMASMLRRGGLALTPKEYHARALICAAFASAPGSRGDEHRPRKPNLCSGGVFSLCDRPQG